MYVSRIIFSITLPGRALEASLRVWLRLGGTTEDCWGVRVEANPEPNPRPNRSFSPPPRILRPNIASMDTEVQERLKKLGASARIGMIYP